jgi:electron transfer flavoprotein alpha subunit
MPMNDTLNLAVKRINPRRPYLITAAGLKRIALGAVHADNGAVDVFGAFAHAAKRPGAQARPRRTTLPAQRSMLVVAYADRGSLDDHARQTLAGAALVADARTQVALLVLGKFNDDAAALGADKLIELPAFERHTFTPDCALAAVRSVAEALLPEHVFFADDASGSGDLGRRYAASVHASIATHVVSLDSERVGVYRKARSEIAYRALPDVLLLAVGAVDPKLPFFGAGERVEGNDWGVAAVAGETCIDLGIEAIDAAQIALEEADFIVSAGNGVSDLATFGALARALGAASGASRVAVDDGRFTRDKQIGATGKTVNASVYVALGISGAVQHLQGIKDCRHVIAVNLDASAPMVKRADLTIIDDAQALMKALLDEVQQARVAKAAATSSPTTSLGEAA